MKRATVADVKRAIDYRHMACTYTGRTSPRSVPVHGPIVKNSPWHLHEWERGAHMTEAFGVDGRRYYCAICGVPYWCTAFRDTPNVCDIHGAHWPDDAVYCDGHGPSMRLLP